MFALWKLRLYDKAMAELDVVGDLNQREFAFDIPSASRSPTKGSYVPFALRLLHARIPQFVGTPKVALERLHELLYETKKVREYLSTFDPGQGICVRLFEEMKS